MKGILIVAIAIAFLTAFAGSCPAAPQEPGGGAKPLVVYFSVPETDKPGNMTREEDNSTVVVDGAVLGNTQYVALLIQERTGADIFRIKPEKPYPVEHRTLVDLAKREQNDKARPKLAGDLPDIGRYDVIFLGYPNWWGDLPMILYTFLEKTNLSGKTVVPFITHGGSGFSRTVDSIASLQPNATVVREGISIHRDAVHDCAGNVDAWLGRLGLKRK